MEIKESLKKHMERWRQIDKIRGRERGRDVGSERSLLYFSWKI
jgi:hypothetical protein